MAKNEKIAQAQKESQKNLVLAPCAPVKGKVGRPRKTEGEFSWFEEQENDSEKVQAILALFGIRKQEFADLAKRCKTQVSLLRNPAQKVKPAPNTKVLDAAQKELLAEMGF
jgi:hypothetical protein